MEKEFVPHNLALKMKQLGYDEPCFFVYKPNGLLEVMPFLVVSKHIGDDILGPTLGQAFKWFREKHGWIHTVNLSSKTTFEYSIDKINNEGVSQYRQDYPFETYEESELCCLELLIELIEV